MIAKAYNDYAINLRREFHKIPEAGFEEYKTSALIKEELSKMNIPFTECVGTGVIGIIEGNREGKTTALRSDIDALCIFEKNDMDYKSTHEGMMHACGHDSHIAMLLTAAKALNDNKDKIKGKVKLIFQPSEEGPVHGAVQVVESGVLEGVDSIYALHVMSDLKVGEITCDGGPRMASADFFEIEVLGSPGHASLPHECIDATVIGASIVMNLQSLVNRELTPLEPYVVTIGAFESGTRHNVISGKAVLKGTVRTFNQEIRSQMPEKIERIAKNIAKSYRGDAKVEYRFGTKPMVNDEESAKMVREIAGEMLGEENVIKTEVRMGGEDFSEYLHIIPGAMFFLGIANDDKSTQYPIHHDCFNIDENALVIGASILAESAIEYLKRN